MDDDAMSLQPTDLGEEPEVSRMVSGDAIVGCSGDGRGGILIIDESVASPVVELDSVVIKTDGDGGARVSDIEKFEKDGLVGCKGSEEDDISEMKPRFSEINSGDATDCQIERDGDSCDHAIVGSSEDGHVGSQIIHESVALTMELDSVVLKRDGEGDCGDRVSDIEKSEKDGLVACKGSEEEDISEMRPRVSEVKNDDTSDCQIERDDDSRDDVVGSSRDGGGELRSMDESAASPMELDSAVPKADDDGGRARVSDRERSEKDGLLASNGSKEDDISETNPRFPDFKCDDTTHSQIERNTVGVGSSGDGHGGSEIIHESPASTIDLDSVAPKKDVVGDGGGRVSDSDRSEKDGLACKGHEEDDFSETNPRFTEIKSEDTSGSQIEKDDDSLEVKDVSDCQSSDIGSEADVEVAFNEEKRGDLEKHTVSDYKSLLSEFDDYVASEKMGSGVSRALSYGFKVGDLVWGKVKSHPWWPGHIFNEAFATPSVRRMRRMDHVLVAFFGDSSYGWFDPAELIPFEPHFIEKSQQTISKHFVRAVEEAVDEASKRSALGLTCKCRNPYNFRPTNVQDYFAVDVPDYELQAVYSAQQIKKYRDSFSPVEILSFVKQLAVAPQVSDSSSLKFSKKNAMVNAFRKAVFEEFDETYAEAFGSVRTSVKTNEPQSRAPPRAPLSGPLVVPETLGDPKSSKKQPKFKDSTKQDKYLLKRRDGAGDKRLQFGQVEASSAASQIQGFGGSSDGDYVTQRRLPPLENPMKHEQPEIVSMDFTSSSTDMPGKEPSVSKCSHDHEKGLAEESKAKIGEKTALFPAHGDVEATVSLKQETGTHSGSGGGSLQPIVEPPLGSHNSAFEGKNSTGGVIKKGKGTKRPSVEMGSENPPLELTKKKKKKKEAGFEPNSDHPEKKKSLSSGEARAKKLAQLGSAGVHSSIVDMRNTEVDVQQLLNHLQALSRDPFSGSSNSSLGATRQFFQHFRSVTYRKSLAVSPSTAAENAKDTKPSKPLKTLKKTEDPSKSGRKRLSSDRQEEISSAKKLKKPNQVKSIASEKKSNREAKNRASLAPAKPVREQSSAVEPTMLVMKFPPGTSLPSAALLKARLGRFGVLDQSAIRVFWKSSTCRVVFMYKADAETALRYATGNKSLFGNVNVRYFLRDVDGPTADEPKSKEDEPIKEPRSQWPDETQPLHQPILPPPNINLKSCLKKPADDPTSNNNGNGNRGTPRVKFMLGGEENTSRATETAAFTVSSRNSNVNFTNAGSSSSGTSSMEFVSKNFQNVNHSLPPSTLPPILPLPPQYTKPLPINRVNHSEQPPMQQPSRYFRGPSTVSVAEAGAGAGASGGTSASVGDVSQQMLNLLVKCNDVVANVTGVLGYVPYHPL